MALMLAGIAAWTVMGIINQRQDLRSVSRHQAISDEYRRIVNEATSASYYFVRVQDEDRPDLLDGFEQSIVDAMAAQDRILAYGRPEDQEFFDELNRDYGELLELGLAAVQSIRSGNITAADLAGEDLLDQVVARLAEEGDLRRTEAQARLRNFESEMSLFFVLTLAMFAIGLPVVAVAFFAVRRIDHDEVVRRGELARLSEAALTDGLTGLGNHRAFQEELGREVARAARANRVLSLAMIDIDDFKEVNDVYGHGRGDSVLADFAHLLSYLRAHDRGFRIGGDEFAIILSETKQADAVAGLERLRTSAAASLQLATISVGVACTADDGWDVDLLKEHADAALYHAKAAGKNQVATYEEQISTVISMTTEKTHALRELLEGDRVRMVYQPIYLLGNKELVAFEALMRAPEDGPLSGPVEAFQAAERIGKSWQLDLLCCSSALAGGAELPAELRLFLNLNPRSLANKSFSAAELALLARTHGLDPSRVVFEITEQTSIPIQMLCEKIVELREAGFGIALDDVGTGNSGLEILRTVRVDYVKIDRSVLVDALNRGPGRAVLLAITAFAREAEAFVIAEGIDSKEMLELISSDEARMPDMVIQGVQGFLVGIPADSIQNEIATHPRYDVAA